MRHQLRIWELRGNYLQNIAVEYFNMLRGTLTEVLGKVEADPPTNTCRVAEGGNPMN